MSATRTPPPELVAALIGKEIRGTHSYRIERLLGQGGTSSVFRGELLVKGRPVAIKVLHAQWARQPEMALRFQREISTAKRITHPNVVSVSDAGSLEDGSLFLVMELLEGTSLASLIEEGPIPPARALAITRQILFALDAAHQHGVVHRDVKPSNVFIVQKDGQEVVKLFDFGIALNDKAAVKLTAAGTAFGTPEYISPEMAMGQKVDGRADLYSLGVVLFEMVTGRLPFVSGDPIALLRAHINEAAPTPRSVSKDVPKPLDALIVRAMSKKPDARFPSAEAMRQAVDAAAGLDSGRRPIAWVLLLILAVLGYLVWRFLL
ncbi:MAG TPA: serine/threonine-protein kinase [Kofleriaceae bacterium]|nr:serine/threonine-protein kinase [Kofleriaceae bacterium]